MVRMEDLNEAQIRAVTYADGPSLVIAGAGSGKTRVLTYKIAWLMEQGMRPENILALTFTNKAAREMRGRIACQVGEDNAAHLWMGTFHSIFARILRIEHEAIGLSPNYTIYDQTDSRALVKIIVHEMGLDEKVYKPASVAARISAAKNSLVLPSAYLSSTAALNADRAARMPAVGEIYQRYFLRCRMAETMDFDDLLLYTWMLFRDHPDILHKYEERFQHVLVDEYQDTNYAQDQIIWQLTQHRQMVTVVGDDAQSIYSFRGANIDNILRFRERYQNARLFKLEQNYRSTRTIVSTASRLISHNKGQIPKSVFSEKEEGVPIALRRCYSDKDEAATVTKKIKELKNRNGIEYANIAVLYRTNAQSRSFEEAFMSAGVPYRIYGGQSFYQRKEIKDAISYMRLAVNPYDEEALRRVINYPIRGIGQTTVDRLSDYAARERKSMWEAMLQTENVAISSGAQKRIESFCTMIQSFGEQVDLMPADELVREILDKSGLREEIFKGREPEDIGRQENMQELIDSIDTFTDEHRQQGLGISLADYLSEVSLLSDVEDNGADEEENGAVTLMTMHAAKGLEFRVVFVVGMEEDLFPSSMAMNTPMGLEEERRLCYVAMTRAEEMLFFTMATSRFRYGRTESMRPSRFLSEIGLTQTAGNGFAGMYTHRASVTERQTAERIISRHIMSGTVSTQGHARLKPVGTTLSVANMNDAEKPSLQVGDRIRHERFGVGIVTAISGSGADSKATVDFDSLGTKQLLLRYAHFVKI